MFKIFIELNASIIQAVPSLHERSFVLRLCRGTILTMFLLYVLPSWGEESYPAECKVLTTLNVRVGESTDYASIGMLYQGDEVVVNSVIYDGSRYWGAINYHGQTGYIAMDYVQYVRPVQQKIGRSHNGGGLSTYRPLMELWDKIQYWSPLSYIVILLLSIVPIRFILNLNYRGILMGFIMALAAGMLSLVLCIKGVLNIGVGFIIVFVVYHVGFIIGLVQSLSDDPWGTILHALARSLNFSFLAGLTERLLEGSSTKDSRGDTNGYSFRCCDNCMYNYTRGSYDVTCNGNYDPNLSPNSKCGSWQHC